MHCALFRVLSRRSFVLLGSFLHLCWQAELYTGAIDCIDHGSKRVGEDGAPVVAGILASPTPLSRRSDILLAQANAALTNALDGFEVPSESVRAFNRRHLHDSLYACTIIMQSLHHYQPAGHRDGMVAGGGAWRYLSPLAQQFTRAVLIMQSSHHSQRDAAHC